MFKITVNENQVAEITHENGKLYVDGQSFQWDIQKISSRFYHILKDNQSYNAEILEADYSKKEFVVKINGNIYQVKAQDSMDLLLEKLGMSNNSSRQIKEVKAPMPGLILDIYVQEKQQVQKGDVLLILEAMKMENAIKSAAEGVIKSIKVSKRQSVEKNQLLLEFE
jgi:biotin carboxyl carrier protein